MEENEIKERKLCVMKISKMKVKEQKIGNE